MKLIKTDFDKKLNRNINTIKRAINNLRGMGFRIEQDKDVETMFGSLVDNIYLRDYMNNETRDKIILQKHLFTIE